MKFSESDLNFSMTDQTSFIQSLLVGIIFVPYHFICDVARKLVFLKREKIETLLLAATIFSAVTLGITVFYYAYTGQMHLFDGNFPVIVPLVSTALMFLIYAYFKSVNFKLFDNLNDFVTLDEVLQDAVMEDVTEVTEITDVEDDVELTEDSPAIAESVTQSVQKNTNDQIDTLDIESEMAALTGLNQSTATVNTENTKNTVSAMKAQSTTANVEPSQALSRDAKKTMYKNKMLKAIYGKLENIKPVDTFSDEEINSLCKDEPFIKSEEFSLNAVEFSFDDL